MLKKLLFAIFIFSTAICYSQEICDNGIDDDNDGFIDLNDEDCECTSFLPTSLIPNQSFEERTCCPMMNARLDCAIGWIQASAATTDYVHTCGNYLGNSSIPAFAPLPFPDGEGAVGFRDGQSNAGAGYKEYVGTCLTEAMEVGTNYRLEFYVGFRDDVEGNKSFDISIFGSDNCNRLPFGNGSTTVGCPANTVFYDEIDTRFVSGSNEWVKVIFEFTPTKPYEVIVIGPSCAPNPNFIFSPYFYLDGLTLAETSDFGIPIDDISGGICEEGVTLSFDEDENQSYQWYKNGIAIEGETNSSITINSGPDIDGFYSAIITLDNGCISSQSFWVSSMPLSTTLEPTTICEGEAFMVGNTAYTQEGVFETTIPASNGCDSTITVTLEIETTSSSILQASFCEGEQYSILDITTSLPGTYESIVTNSNGCDSIITIELTEISKSGGIVLPTDLSIELGDLISISPLEFDDSLIDFVWYNEENEVIANSIDLIDIQPTENSILTIEGSDQFGCSSRATIEINVDNTSVTVHMPNVFSPDDNRINDIFSFIPTKAVRSIESFIIYDRWGNQVFKDIPLEDVFGRKGWDGTFNGKYAEQGVYSYTLNATFLNGVKKSFAGSLTLIRF